MKDQPFRIGPPRGEISPEAAASIREQFNAAVRSANESWRMPIYLVEDVEYLKVSGCQDCAEHGARYCPTHGEKAQ